MQFTRATASAAVLVVIALLIQCVPASADPVVWNGPTIAFTKPDGADWTLPVNQDRLTDNVWLTRGDTLPLFNIAVDPGATSGTPADTEWAFGPTQPGNPGPTTASNHANLVFDSFPGSLDGAIGRNAVGYSPGVLHLMSDDIYLNIKFTSWTQESGGGFSYIRSTPGQPPPVPEPASATLLIVGAAVGVATRRRKTTE